MNNSSSLISLLGYIRVNVNLNQAYYDFPIPVVTPELKSQYSSLVLGLDIPTKELVEPIQYLFRDPKYLVGAVIGVANIELSSDVICPFLYYKMDHILITSPIYIYSNIIRRYLKNSKLAPNKTLQLEFYFDNIEILTFKIVDILELDAFDCNKETYSKFPEFTEDELFNLITPSNFEDITIKLLTAINQANE